MLRGINRQNIFECKGDYLKFIDVLARNKEKCGYRIYAYCLMSNHVHLLIACENDDVSDCIKRIAISYSYYYNYKNMRSGHLFQDRFRSEPIEDDAYFLAVARYIHMNPVKAGICSKPEKYAWSSYLEYLNVCGTKCVKMPAAPVTDTGMLLGMIGPGKFVDFTNTLNDDKFLEISDKPRIVITDDDARSLMKDKFGIGTVTSIQAMDKHRQCEAVDILFDAGANTTQICRLTGISRPTIVKILHGLHGDGSW